MLQASDSLQTNDRNRFTFHRRNHTLGVASIVRLIKLSARLVDSLLPASLQRKLKKERRTRRSLQDRLQSLDRGPTGHCYAPVTNALHAALHQAVPASGADCSGGSSGDGCRDDRHLGLLLIQGQDKRRLRNGKTSNHID